MARVPSDHKIWGDVDPACSDFVSSEEGVDALNEVLANEVEWHESPEAESKKLLPNVGFSELCRHYRPPVVRSHGTANPVCGNDGPPSEGSAAHAAGKCTPCRFWSKGSGCLKGTGCKFCHLHGQGRCMIWRRRAKNFLSERD
mmetsp:Transcript_97744/g.226645  ORF Transcript_97744/g.226645 Transcript_97744/m.226645 type:complete len:143 (+) Transcript_97744:116-544(+)